MTLTSLPTKKSTLNHAVSTLQQEGKIKKNQIQSTTQPPVSLYTLTANTLKGLHNNFPNGVPFPRRNPIDHQHQNQSVLDEKPDSTGHNVISGNTKTTNTPRKKRRANGEPYDTEKKQEREHKSPSAPRATIRTQRTPKGPKTVAQYASLDLYIQTRRRYQTTEYPHSNHLTEDG